MTFLQLAILKKLVSIVQGDTWPAVVLIMKPPGERAASRTQLRTCKFVFISPFSEAGLEG
jgi:hypothetical protein